MFAATGARLRRLTTTHGEHWFPAMDVAKHLGYANTRDAVLSVVSQQHATTFGDIARSVGLSDARRNTAGHGFRTTMKLVNLQGLIQLVHGCTKPESQPFKNWVSEVIAIIQRDGSYSLEPSPAQTPATGTPAYFMPKQVADAIVRLEVRNIQADEIMAAFQREQTELLREISRSQNTIARDQSTIARSHRVIAESLQDIAQTLKLRHPEAKLTPQQLLVSWKAKNLVFTEDIHAVAAYLAPALVRGEASYRMADGLRSGWRAGVRAAVTTHS
ncbi:Bro-N domain-containing protein [Streptomyces sp. NPDC050619]|uniref:BRO-N domain-containing protein n=1 Tax=Streptomyces sp. NPDC050619 TaxID=3157214 RepID=UPI003414F166